MYWLIAIPAIALTIFLVWASADVGSNVYLKAVCKKNTEEKVVALTFDDGPNERMTPLVLDVLKKHDIKATFFLIGNKADRHPEIVRRMVSEGHIVANHTFSHKGTFPLSSPASVRKELKDCNTAIEKIIGKKPRLFRPPFGVTNPIIGKEVVASGMLTVGWSIRSLDTLEKRERKEVCDRIMAKLHPGAIILLHDRCKDSDILLEALITSIIEHGYSFISIDKILKDNVYEN